MKKHRQDVAFVCQGCGHQEAKWFGRCPSCDHWDSATEETVLARPVLPRRGGIPEPIALDAPSATPFTRMVTGMDELDRTLGGGIVPGSLLLVGGDPGIGKSTLLLQMFAAVARQGASTLYITGEESIEQIRMRAGRIGCLCSGQLVAAETCVETIVAMALAKRPGILAVDSIQTVYSNDFPSAPGSVTQVRESAARLLGFAKKEGIPVVLVGHVTKEGAIAGPKILEHMVDTVLSFEGDKSHAFRLLRTTKNRFGSTNEIGVFSMNEGGLAEVDNPSEVFLAERPADVPGSVVFPSMEGTRPILVEVQALVAASNLATPRRTSIGADPQRLALLTAVLEKKAGLPMFSRDIFLNIAGGIRIAEPALDLAVVSALASSALDRNIPAHTAVCGEVGLAGEVRAVGHMEIRLREAARLGFSRFLMPRGNKSRLGKLKGKIEVQGIGDLRELLEELF